MIDPALRFSVGQCCRYLRTFYISRMIFIPSNTRCISCTEANTLLKLTDSSLAYRVPSTIQRTWADPNNLLSNHSELLPSWAQTDRRRHCFADLFCIYGLRDSIHDMDKRARISAVYNIFAMRCCFLHLDCTKAVTKHSPRKSGTLRLTSADIDNNMRMIFYPAVIGWTLLGVWITNLENTNEFYWKKKRRCHDTIQKIVAVFLFSHSPSIESPGSNKKVEMADMMRSNGRIYVVVAVMLTIFNWSCVIHCEVSTEKFEAGKR